MPANKSQRLFLLLLVTRAACSAGDAKPSVQNVPSDLTQLSLEDLANIEITSASRKPQKLSRTAAAVYVITQEDIRRSGATSIPEALRMAPGLDVARIDSSTWAVSSRGFNGQYSNKMLVLLDGRSVYSPLYSGVYWDEQDVMLEDIERIEVIRGPGAAMWGINAVNGVINIITKRARDTQGTLITAGGGTQEQGFGSVRYGSGIGSHAQYRVYSKYSALGQLSARSGQPAGDAWRPARGGFRLDWDPSARDSITFEGDAFESLNGEPLLLPSLQSPYSQAVTGRIDSTGGDLLARWQRRFSGGSEMALQVSYDHTRRNDALLGETRNTIDVELQHQLTIASRHEIVWGLGERYSTDQTKATPYGLLDPAVRGLEVYSGFVQDDVRLIADRLHVSAGARLDHNDYTGSEFQPSVRLLWTPSQEHGFWLSAARASRVPPRGAQDGILNLAALADPSGVPVLVSYVGSHHVGSEVMNAYEAGYRLQPVGAVSLDVAAFYNRYARLSSFAAGAPTLAPLPVPHVQVPIHQQVAGSGRTYGLEVVGRWNPTPRWQLTAGYTGYVGLSVSSGNPAPSSLGQGGGYDPASQVQLRSYLDLTRALQFDVDLYYVARLPALQVSGYWRLDTRLGYRLRENLELSVAGQNLGTGRHLEFISEVLTRPTEIGRSVYAKLTWRF